MSVVHAVTIYPAVVRIATKLFMRSPDKAGAARYGYSSSDLMNSLVAIRTATG